MVYRGDAEVAEFIHWSSQRPLRLCGESKLDSKEAAGLLRNRHDFEPLACQRDLRKQWNTRLKRLGLSSRYPLATRGTMVS